MAKLKIKSTDLKITKAYIKKMKKAEKENKKDYTKDYQKEYQEYSEMDLATFENKINEIEKKLNEKSKKIIGIEKALENLKENPEKKAEFEKKLKEVKTEKNKLRKKLIRMQGFAKNRVALGKIDDYKSKLDARVKKLKEEIKNNNKKIKDIKKEKRENSKKILTIKKMNNEDFSKNWEEYNKLLKKVKELEEKEKALTKANEKIDKELEILNCRISKCRLAYECLFNDKTWDQIHAYSLDGRYNKKEVKKEDAEVKKEDDKSLKPVKKWEKILAFIKHPIITAKNHIKKRKIEEKIEEKVEEKVERDPFIVELQKMTGRTQEDNERAVEKAIERHKAKVAKNPEKIKTEKEK